jgi:ferredoxin
MANLKKSVPENVPGDFFVDSICIDCDTCRQLAPAVFAEGAGPAFVRRQPASHDERRDALHALACCPTGSIGSRGNDKPQSVMDDFPLLIEDPARGLAEVSASPGPANRVPGRHREHLLDPSG